jgi:tetratricopeptide (TPR) repeat protein
MHAGMLLAALRPSAYYTPIQWRGTPGQIIKHIEDTLNLAREHYTRGEIAQAAAGFAEVLEADSGHREALESLVVIALQGGKAAEAEQYLRRLVGAHADEPLYCDRLATLLERQGRSDDAIACYRALLQSHPEFNNSRYNLARLLKRAGRPEDALREYDECIAGGIERVEEVHTNISVIHTDAHRHEEARAALQRALQANPDYAPALFNMGLLLEERGEWPQASALFQQILSREPRHSGALVHLANGERVTDPVAPVIRNMKRTLRQDSRSGEPALCAGQNPR